MLLQDTHPEPAHPLFPVTPQPHPVLRLLALPFQFLAYLLAFVLWGVLGLFLTLACGLLRILLPARFHRPVGQGVIHGLFRFFVAYLRVTGLARVDFSALEALRGQPPMILAPNHPCLMDAVFIIARLPRVTCVLKSAILDNPVLGGGARLAGYLRNDAPMELINGAVAELHAGRQLLLFPEGTRTVEAPLNPLKGGFAMIATRAAVPVQTILIETSCGYLGKNWGATRIPPFPLMYRATLGERFTPGPEETPRQFLQRVENYFRRALDGPEA